MTESRRRRALLLLLACIGLSTAACNRRLLGLFFDVPAQRTKAEQPSQTAAQIAALMQMVESGTTDTVKPALEGTLDPDSVIRALPRDVAGNIDWMAALKSSLIKPRAALPGKPNPEKPGSFQFAFDFFFPGPDTTFDALFQHSSHTAWLNCSQCHARIFKYRGTPIKMGDIFQGKYCAECHGKVAYPVMTACERCHTKMKLPPNRAKPELLGTIKMTRAAPERSDSTLDGNAAGVRTNDFPTAQFPHWVHRIRYKCKSCHMEVFEPKAGANQILMKDIREGRACGVCHNGATAFPAAFGYCERCHIPPKRPAAAQSGD